MKLIVAIIQPDKLDEVHQALIAAENFRITVSRVTGHGRQEDPELYAARRCPSLIQGAPEDRRQRGLRRADGRGDPGGREARRRGHRRRQDLHPAARAGHPHPHGRARRRGHLASGRLCADHRETQRASGLAEADVEGDDRHGPASPHAPPPPGAGHPVSANPWRCRAPLHGGTPPRQAPRRRCAANRCRMPQTPRGAPPPPAGD